MLTPQVQLRAVDVSRKPARSAHWPALVLAGIAGAAASVGCAGRSDSSGPVGSTSASAGGAPSLAAASASALLGCPAQLPEPGSSCAGHAPWIRCEYDYCFGGKAQVSCNPLSGAWDPLGDLICYAVAPLAPGCPARQPVPGSDCEAEDLTCEYRSDCHATPPDSAQCRFGQWRMTWGLSANCDHFVPPACPERPIIDTAGCAYEGQTCAPSSCAPGSASREGHRCLNGFWRAAALTCSGDVDALDGF